MPISFQLQERLAGFSASRASGGRVEVITREFLSFANRDLTSRLDQLNGVLFRKIDGLPDPCLIRSLLVIIKQDLSGVAYVNDEVALTARAKVTRDVKAGEPVRLSDISDVASVGTSIVIPPSAAVVTVLCHEWRRSVFYDFGPLGATNEARSFAVEDAIKLQLLQLWGLAGSDKTQLDRMRAGLAHLNELLAKRSDHEADYQALLIEHPWMFGGTYASVSRHTKMDDENIPDFTAVRSADARNDVIEIKQPFLSLVRGDGELSSEFNNAWNQAERYLVLATDHRHYLRERKGLIFENPTCRLLLGYRLPEPEERRIRDKMKVSPVQWLSYDALIRQAENLLNVAERAAQPWTEP